MLHDTGDWKDLNLKFVISSYRDCIWAITDKTERLRLIDHFYPSVQRIIDDAIGEWDIDGDSMIENGGFPDQTYDAWTMKGTRFPPPRQLSKIDANW
jgi:non-lysosomal glucosylceramidase